MHIQRKSSRLFRLVVAMIVFVLVFSQFVGQTQAQEGTPPGKERVQIAQANLDEIQNYYGRLSDLQGNIGVVVELEDTPAALIYANGTSQSTALAQNQSHLIQNKQTNFMSTISGLGIQATELYRTQKVYNGIWMKVDSKDLTKLVAIPGVKAIHPMIPKTLDHTTSVPLIGAPQVWGGLSAARGEGITIGIIDTGIDYVHTNFGGAGIYTGQDFTTLGEIGNLFPTAKVIGGWDFAGDAYNADPDSLSYSPIPVPDPDPMDCYGHGSHVAGTAAGFGVNTDGTTYVESLGDTYADLGALTSSAYISKFRIGPGVAPKAELYSLRVFGCAGSTDLTELAIEWAMDPNGDSDLSDHLDVINMSLGSDFGSEYDTSAVASNNAALAGVLVVASAGNANDVYYITGAPAVARYAISVAASVDSGAVVSAFEVTAPISLAGNYAGVEAAFGPDPGTPGVTGDILTTTPANGCTAISTVLTGKIALIDRGVCTFKTKVLNAQNAGAIGVLVANNVVGFPISMGDDTTISTPITIPSMMTTLAIGNLIKTQLIVPTTVTVRLTSQYKNQFQMTDASVEDTLASFSSRGPARAGTLLKPDLTAPGDSIFSTANGTGDEGASFNGTSMAAPHVAGVMALLKQIHPTWTVPELKALAMNTATNDLWTSIAHTAVHTPTRVGAGRVSAADAALSSVVAYNAADPGQVNLAFGEQAVLGIQSFVKSITIKNTAGTSAAYTVTFNQYYQSNPGLTFTLLDASDAALTNPVTVPASGTLEIKVKVDADASVLSRARDASISTSGGRQRFSEGGGYVTLTSTGSDPTLRVPVHIAARPASSMSVAESGIILPSAATGTFSLTPTGTPVDTASDTSLVDIMELLGTSPNDVSSSGPNDAADLQYIGATSDYPFYPFTDPDPLASTAAMYFGVATYGKWDTANATEFDVYLDVNEDSTDDYVVFNTNQGFFTGTTDDVMFTVFCDLPAFAACDAWYYVNGISGATNTNLFNNNVMTLVVPLSEIGLVEGVNTDFNFQVVTFNRDAAGVVDTSDVMSYDVANQAFTAVDPVNTGMPMWLDDSAASPTFDITYDKAAIAANVSKGLLLLHHHNASTSTAEVLPVVTTATFSDVPLTYWAWEFIERLYDSGITAGCSTSPLMYCPEASTTRAEMAVFLLKSEHGSSYTPPAVGSSTGFTDVPTTYWAAAWIKQLALEGITAGCATNLYCPDANVTRAQMAVFLLKSEHGPSYSPPDVGSSTGFTDVPTTYWAAAWIKQLAAEGITGGCGIGTYCPDNPVTRAEMAVFLVRTFNLP